MAVVTECLFQLIAKQVEDRRLVLWYDPERVYTQAVAELALPQTTIVRYGDSFFSLVSVAKFVDLSGNVAVMPISLA